MESSLRPSNQAPGKPTRSRRKSSPDDGASLPKKPRASKPKVRSGCLTCKARRVKCDERKPGCARCENFGRACDGYASQQPRTATVQLKPRMPSLHSPTIPLHRNEDEHRYFEVFRTRTAYELSGYSENPFWHELVLQESHHHLAIRHAVIALGALMIAMNKAPPPDYKVNIIQTMDKKHLANALQSYHNAICYLNNYISTSSSAQLRVALITCLLIICFETIQGSVASSVQQTYGGLKILRNYYAGPGYRQWIPRKKTLAKNAKLRTKQNSQISQAIMSRLGCDGAYKQKAMIIHVEEYLAGAHESPELVQEPKPFMEQTPGTEITEFSVTVSKPASLGLMGITPFHRQHDNVEEIPPHAGNSKSPANDGGTPLDGNSPGSSTAMQHSRSSTGSIRTMDSTSLTLTPETLTPLSENPFTPSSSNSESPTSTAENQMINKKRKRSLENDTVKPRNLLQNDQRIEDSIFQAFVRLDGQGLFFGMVPGIPPLVWDIHSIWHHPIPSAFSNFREAQHCWDFLMDRAIQFYRRTQFNAFYQPANTQSREEIEAQHTMYITQLTAFKNAFRPILDAAFDSNGRMIHPATLVLSLYQKLLLIFLNRVIEDSEQVYDNYLPEFKDIVATASLIISYPNVPLNPRFSFDMGVVPPLHVTATRCRDPIVRREAIALLFKVPRQEGMWDGILSARVGCWLVKQEEEGLPPPALPIELKDLPGKEVRTYSPPYICDAQARANTMIRTLKATNTGTASGLGEIEETASYQGPGTSSISVNDALDKNWTVPLKNRVQLMMVDYHVPDRNIQIYGQKVVPDSDGKHPQVGTLISW